MVRVLNEHQLKQTFWIVFRVKANSGWAWSNEKGAGIIEATQSTWDDYVRAHPKAAPFKTSGWPYMEAMEEVMPAVAPGAHIYAASNGTQGREAQAVDTPTADPPIDPALTGSDSGGNMDSGETATEVDHDEIMPEHATEEGQPAGESDGQVCSRLLYLIYCQCN